MRWLELLDLGEYTVMTNLRHEVEADAIITDVKFRSKYIFLTVAGGSRRESVSRWGHSIHVIL